MNNPVLVCTDLDRTLLPNGLQVESAHARTRFAQLVDQPWVSLAYVTGRHRELVLEAMAQYKIPEPDYVIGDVGSSIYLVRNGQWQLWSLWQDKIAPDWRHFERGEIAELLTDIEGLTLQEAEKQNVYKLSYYTPVDIEVEQLRVQIQQLLKQQGIKASVIWSIDDLKHLGLLDVLPANATKLHAIEFLMQQQGFSHERTVFAGDSGNDLPVLTSPINSVLVANARDDVRQQALGLAAASGNAKALYVALGGFLGMNGNYSAGILEGLAHFVPDLRH